MLIKYFHQNARYKLFRIVSAASFQVYLVAFGSDTGPIASSSTSSERDSVDRASRWYRQGQAEAQAGQRSDGSLHPQAGRAYLRDALPQLISSCRCIALSCRSRACQLAALGGLPFASEMGNNMREILSSINISSIDFEKKVSRKM